MDRPNKQLLKKKKKKFYLFLTQNRDIIHLSLRETESDWGQNIQGHFKQNKQKKNIFRLHRWARWRPHDSDFMLLPL